MIQPHGGIKTASFSCREMTLQNPCLKVFIFQPSREILNPDGDFSQEICLEHCVGKI